MKLLNPSYTILNPEYSLEGIYKHIEYCGRTCYHSQDKITDDSAKSFVERMIKSKHYSVLEHGTVYLYVPYTGFQGSISCKIGRRYETNEYSEVVAEYKSFYITTNMRVIVENGWEKDLKYISNPTPNHILRHSVKLVTNIQVYKELTRHRKMSFSIESTRYCNYSKDKFDKELSFIAPCWDYKTPAFIETLKKIETAYLELISLGWSPQQAAGILPQETKAEVIMSGFDYQWEYVFKLRTSIIHATGMPHPQVCELMDPLYKEFIEKNYITI